MTEFVPTAEQIKDVQLMNVTFTVGALLESIATGIKHVGDDLYSRVSDKENPVSESEASRIDHHLEILGRSMQSLTKAIQVNDIGSKLVHIPKESLTAEASDILKEAASATKEVEEMVMVMKETPEEAMTRLLLKELAREGGFSLSKEELDMLSGN